MEIISEINNNNPVIVPTETVYGIISKINKESISKIYLIKKRSKKKPLTIIINNFNSLEDFVLEIPINIKKILETFWPGPLTVIFKKKNNDICNIIGTEKTIGIRMPNHNFLRAILKYTGPLVCTSANISNDIDPISIDCIS